MSALLDYQRGFDVLALMADGGGKLSVDEWLAHRRQTRRNGELPAIT